MPSWMSARSATAGACMVGRTRSSIRARSRERQRSSRELPARVVTSSGGQGSRQSVKTWISSALKRTTIATPRTARR